jgi:hypothetical protein
MSRMRRRFTVAALLWVAGAFPLASAQALAQVASAAQPPAAALAPSGGDALMYIGTYGKAVYVIDEATGTVEAKIPLRTGIPRQMILSHDQKRFYVIDATQENVEVVDIAERRTVDSFSLSKPNEKVRIWGFNVEPRDRYAILLTKTYKKLSDRYEVTGPHLLRYDLAQHQVTDTIKWPQNETRESARLLFSPNGEHLYFFSADSTLVYETQRFTEVDRWQYAQSLDEGMGRFEFGFPSQAYEPPGFYTGLFRFTDPVQNRRMMGVARVNLAERSVDFFTLGPNENVSFALAPGGARAYGLRQEVGNYEFWTFDIANRRMENRARFAGRPRMGLVTSSNGQLLYIYVAGNTIDVYDAATYRYLRTIELDADSTTIMFVLPRQGPASPAARETREE